MSFQIGGFVIGFIAGSAATYMMLGAMPKLREWIFKSKA